MGVLVSRVERNHRFISKSWEQSSLLAVIDCIYDFWEHEHDLESWDGTALTLSKAFRTKQQVKISLG